MSDRTTQPLQFLFLDDKKLDMYINVKKRDRIERTGKDSMIINISFSRPVKKSRFDID